MQRHLSARKSTNMFHLMQQASGMGKLHRIATMGADGPHERCGFSVAITSATGFKPNRNLVVTLLFHRNHGRKTKSHRQFINQRRHTLDAVRSSAAGDATFIAKPIYFHALTIGIGIGNHVEVEVVDKASGATVASDEVLLKTFPPQFWAQKTTCSHNIQLSDGQSLEVELQIVGHPAIRDRRRGGVHRSCAAKLLHSAMVAAVAVNKLQRFSLSATHALVGEQIGKSSPMAKMIESKTASGKMTLHRNTASASLQQCLEEIRAEPPGCNWFLVAPLGSAGAKPVVVGAGLGSIDEMRFHLEDDQVLYGLLRLGFGKGMLRRDKYCYFEWSGPKVASMQRARTRNGPSKALEKAFGPSHLGYTASASNETTVDAIIPWMLSRIASDSGSYSIETFKVAVQDDLHTQAAVAAQKLPKPADPKPKHPPIPAGGRKPVEATVTPAPVVSDDSTDDSDDDDEIDRVRVSPLPTIVSGEDDGGPAALVVDLGYATTHFGMAHEINFGPTSIQNQGAVPGTPLITRTQYDSCHVDWAGMEQLWDRLYDTELELESAELPVLCTVDPHGPLAYAENLCEMLFENFSVPALNFSAQSLLTLYSCGKTSGLVVNSGECSTSVLAVYDGVCIKHAARQLKMGGRDVSQYIATKLKDAGYEGSPAALLEVAGHMKQNWLGMGVASKAKAGAKPAAAAGVYTMPDGRVLKATDDVVKDLEPTPEMFYFRPRELPNEFVGFEFGVDDMVARAVRATSIDAHNAMTQNMVLCGGNTMFPGCEAALVRRLKSTSSPVFSRMKVCSAGSKTAGHDYTPAEAAWLGGCLLSQSAGFEPFTTADYDERGPEALCNEMNILRIDGQM